MRNILTSLLILASVWCNAQQLPIFDKDGKWLNMYVPTVTADTNMPQYASMVQWFRCNSTGKTNDSSPLNVSGLVNDGGATAPTWVSDSEGYYYDGGDYQMSTSKPYISATQLTFSVWAKMSNHVADAGIWCMRASVLHGISLNTFPTQGNIGYVASQPALGTGSNVVGQWVHLMTTWRSGEKVVLYVNGISNASTASDVTTNAVNNDYTRFGLDDISLSRKFNGLLDDGAIWTNKLTPAEVLQVYNLGH